MLYDLKVEHINYRIVSMFDMLLARVGAIGKNGGHGLQAFFVLCLTQRDEISPSCLVHVTRPACEMQMAGGQT